MKKWRKHDAGAETIKADLSSNKVKKPDIISAPGKKEATAAEKPPKKKVEKKKPGEKKPEEKPKVINY